MVAMVAVDCQARFRLADMKWAGGTHDAVAFAGIQLYDMMINDQIPEHLHILGDEAFCAIGSQLITPYSKRSLRALKTTDTDLYLKQRSFNFLLSVQRSTVERAFGMLLRKFIILTSAARRFVSSNAFNHPSARSSEGLLLVCI